MNQDTIRSIITVAVLILIFAVAMSLLGWLIRILLPLSIIVIAAYIVYKLINRSKY